MSPFKSNSECQSSALKRCRVLTLMSSICWPAWLSDAGIKVSHQSSICGDSMDRVLAGHPDTNTSDSVDITLTLLHGHHTDVARYTKVVLVFDLAAGTTGRDLSHVARGVSVCLHNWIVCVGPRLVVIDASPAFHAQHSAALDVVCSDLCSPQGEFWSTLQYLLANYGATSSTSDVSPLRLTGSHLHSTEHLTGMCGVIACAGGSVIRSYVVPASRQVERPMCFVSDALHGMPRELRMPMGSGSAYVIGMDVGGSSATAVLWRCQIDRNCNRIFALEKCNTCSSQTFSNDNDSSFDLIDLLVQLAIKCTANAHVSLEEIVCVSVAWFGNVSKDGERALLFADNLQRLCAAFGESYKDELERLGPTMSKKLSGVPVLIVGDSEAIGLALDCSPWLHDANGTYLFRFGTSVGGVFWSGRDAVYDRFAFHLPSRVVCDMSDGALRHSASRVRGAWQPHSASRGFSYHLQQVLEESVHADGGGGRLSAELRADGATVDRVTSGKLVGALLESPDAADVAIGRCVISRIAERMVDAILVLADIHCFEQILLDGTSLQGVSGSELGREVQRRLAEAGLDIRVRKVEDACDIDDDARKHLVSWSAAQVAARTLLLDDGVNILK